MSSAASSTRRRAFRLHGERCDLGYNVSLAATRRFVRESAAFTGASPDSGVVAPAIAAQVTDLGMAPPRFLYDRAAGSPKRYAEVDKVSGGQTQLVARLIDHAKSNPLFGPQDCTLGEDGGLTCPAGRTTSRCYRAQGGDGWHYRFMPDQCQGCPLWASCRQPQAKATSPRNFFISDYAFHQRKALAYLKSDAFHQEMRLRPLIERIIACLVRYHGAARCRRLRSRQRRLPGAHGSHGLQSQDLGQAHQRKEETQAQQAGRRLFIIVAVRPGGQRYNRSLRGETHSPDSPCAHCLLPCPQLPLFPAFLAASGPLTASSLA